MPFHTPSQPIPLFFMGLALLPTALKAEGNDAFGKGDYVAAIQKYTEGLKKQKDMQVLYTNRAQVGVDQEGADELQRLVWLFSTKLQ